MTVQAILFDMDGVLVDAREWHYRALNRALAVHGFTITEAEHLDRYDGLPTRVKLAQLTRERGLPVGLYDEINDAKQRFTIDEINIHARPSPHHLVLLHELTRRNFRLALCSNARRETVELMLERTQLEPLLELVLSADDVQRTKPDPEIYLHAMRRFALPPAACLVVEDSPFGVRAARAAGAHVLAVDGPGDVECGRILAELQRIDFASAERTGWDLAFRSSAARIARTPYRLAPSREYAGERSMRESDRP